MSNKRLEILLFLSILSFIILSGCDGSNLISAWRDHEIVINGKYTDFGNTMAYYDEKEKIGINLLNDRDYLYVCVISGNNEIETQIMKSGLMLWFDPNGGNNKVFGIRFPAGTKEAGTSTGENETRGNKDWEGAGDIESEIPREGNRHRNSERELAILEAFQESLIEVMIGPAKGKVMPIELSLEDAGRLGIAAKTGHENDHFVYELKVPLIKSSQYQYSIGAKIGKPMGLGLEIAALETKRTGGRMHRGRGMGGMAAGAISEIGHSMMHQRKGFQLWRTVKLSPGPSI